MDEDMILPDDFQEEGIPAEEIEGEEPQDAGLEVEGMEPEGIEPEAEETNVDNQEEGEEGTPADEPFIKVKYNKEEIGLTKEQVIELSQKGMNYDKLLERYNQSVNNPTLQYFQDLAERNGMDLDGLVSYYQQQEEQAELDYLQREKGLTEELAKEVMENRKFRQKLESERKLNEQQQQRENEWKMQQEEFISKYPQVDPKNIPQSVWDDWKNGERLTTAYMKYENEELRKENSILKQNTKNKVATPITKGISVNGSKSVEKEDAFMMGFNSI